MGKTVQKRKEQEETQKQQTEVKEELQIEQKEEAEKLEMKWNPKLQMFQQKNKPRPGLILQLPSGEPVIKGKKRKVTISRGRQQQQ